MDQPSLPSRRKVLIWGASLAFVAGSAGALYRLVPRFYNSRRLREFEGRRVYDENADAEALLNGALTRARSERKRVLVVIGGNWCKWCLALDDLFKSDPEIRDFLARHFIVLKLDGDAASELDERWGKPTKLSVPVLVFLNADGKVLHIQETVALERWGGRILAHDKSRVLSVLSRWSH